MKTTIIKKIIVNILWKIGYVVILERPLKKPAFIKAYGEILKS